MTGDPRDPDFFHPDGFGVADPGPKRPAIFLPDDAPPPRLGPGASGAQHPATGPVPEVTEPMIVVWQGVEYPTAAWDVHGFRLSAPIPRVVGPGRGRVIDVTLLLGRGSTRIEMRVHARAIDATQDQPTAYGFVDLERAQAEVLHRIVDNTLSNQALSLTSLLNDTTETHRARAETGALQRRVRTTLQLGLAVAVALVAAFMTWAKLSAVTARFAAVTVAATTVPAPVAGMITRLDATPGPSVQPGDALGITAYRVQGPEALAATPGGQMVLAPGDVLAAAPLETDPALFLAGLAPALSLLDPR